MNFISSVGSYKISWKKNENLSPRTFFSLQPQCDRQQLRKGEKPSEYKGIRTTLHLFKFFFFFMCALPLSKKGSSKFSFQSNDPESFVYFTLLLKKEKRVRFSSYFTFVFLRIYWSCRNFSITLWNDHEFFL